MRIHQVFGHGWILAPVPFCVFITLDEVEVKRNAKQRTGPTFNDYYTLHSLSVFSVAKNLQLILEISTTHRLTNLTISIQVPCDGVFVVIDFLTMYNKTIVRFSFSDILNNQVLGKCYQPRPSTQLIARISTLSILILLFLLCF